MADGMQVSVAWSPSKTTRPTNGVYSTVAFFPHDPDWPRESWSVTLRFDPPSAANEHPAKATAEFLNPDAAPKNLLTKGASFAMLERYRITALVVVD
jgi:hypothetical protein